MAPHIEVPLFTMNSKYDPAMIRQAVLTPCQLPLKNDDFPYRMTSSLRNLLVTVRYY